MTDKLHPSPLAAPVGASGEPKMNPRVWEALTEEEESIAAAAAVPSPPAQEPSKDDEIRRWRQAEQELSSRYVKLRMKLERFGALDTKRNGEDRFEKTEAALDAALSEIDRLTALAPPSPRAQEPPLLKTVTSLDGKLLAQFYDYRYFENVTAALRLVPPSPPVADRPTKVSGETSDGYHTFNDLYAYRKAYNALLFNEWAARDLYDVHKSWRHSDGEVCFGGGWFIVSAYTPTGQITNHYEAADWDLFQVPKRERATAWDGHTPAIALERLLTLASAPAAPAGAAKDKA